MTAKEAKEVSVQKDDVLSRIKVAAFEGLAEITYNAKLNKPVIDGLSKLGYKVRCERSGLSIQSSTKYKISWN